MVSICNNRLEGKIADRHWAPGGHGSCDAGSERLALNHEWLWRGKGMNCEPDKSAHLLEHVRELIQAGSYEDGIDFLGFYIRQFKGSCYTLPQKEKVLDLLDRIRT